MSTQEGEQIEGGRGGEWREWFQLGHIEFEALLRCPRGITWLLI